MRTRNALAAGVFALAACAHHGEPMESIERSRHVDQRMLVPNATAGAASAVEAYEMRPQEHFRMPQAIAAPTPELPADSPRTALAPTTVCVHIVVSEQGLVQAVDPHNDRPECTAGVATENADLLQAVQGQLSQWTYTPAAICTWNAGTPPPPDDDCTGAAKIEPVPVSLLYAFTFEIREGKATVRGGRAP